MSKKDINALRDNAVRRSATDVVRICDLALSELKPASQRTKPSAARPTAEYVAEYHFVCRDDRGVTFLSDGTFRSASWVVAHDEIEKSLRFGAKLALHNSKLEPSYRQGTIIGFERIDDFQDGETRVRIDFLVTPDEGRLDWAGGGTGEKGYLWSSDMAREHD
ncbi:hypothetical protein [Bosea sp. (in: a-proteobacteria)]|uniref:hypothetical protein n=1 Tax=Bosea sp. (in: a-proteobacteria) TaxID=1871050 RepID=UPI002FCC397E